MRMWMIDPKLLCRKHLLGEHGEIHKHLPSLRKGHRVDGRFSPVVQIQFQEFENYLEGLRKEYFENPELPAEAIYIFESRAMDNPF